MRRFVNGGNIAAGGRKMRKRKWYIAVMIAAGAAAGAFMADRYRVDKEIREFDRRMKEWKQEQRNAEGE